MLGGPAKACYIVMLRSHVTCSICVFGLDTCCCVNIIRPNIEVGCTVREPCIVALFCDNQLHNPVGQHERPWVWKRQRVTGISGARVRVRLRDRVMFRDFIYITWRLPLRLCPSIRSRLLPKCDLLEVHCWTAAVAAHYVGVT